MEQGLLFEQPPIQTPAAKLHASGKHWLFNSLLNGCYIMERGGHSKTFTHCLFELNSVPVRKISRDQWKKINVLMRYKKLRRGTIYFLNLKEVRSLHGNCNFKKLYKQFKQHQKTKHETENL